MRRVPLGQVFVIVAMLFFSSAPTRAAFVAQVVESTLTTAAQAGEYDFVSLGNHLPDGFRSSFHHPFSLSIYDSGTNRTTSLFTGDPITTGQTLTVGFYLASNNFNSVGLGVADIVSQVWKSSNASVENAFTSFTVGQTPQGPTDGQDRIEILRFVEQSASAGENVYVAAELPSGSYSLCIVANNTYNPGQILSAKTMTLTPTDVGLPRSDPAFNQTLLNMLDSTHLPPSDPRWTPIPGIPDNTTIPLNSTVTGTTPEPSTSLFLIALSSLVLRRRRDGANPES